MAKDLLDKLADKMLIGDGCWEWTGAKIPAGYGSVGMPGGQRGAHRVVYELLVGPIPEGMHLHHECGNRWCVRPAHLSPLAAEEHSRDHDVVGGWAREVKPTLLRCRNGHAYPEDAPTDSRGARLCGECSRERSRSWRIRHGDEYNAKRRESRAAGR